MRCIVMTLLILASAPVMAEPVADVYQKFKGDVTAKLDASNLSNVAVSNSAVGNGLVVTNPNASISINQDTAGDITSELDISNLTNQTVEQNVAGTLMVVN